MFFRKENEGITLIALVITIIVLLILAGITIATLTGDNGILTKVNEAKKATTEADAIESVKVEVMGSYGTDGKINIETLNNNLSNIIGLKYNGKDISENNKILGENLSSAIVKVNGYYIEITLEGKVSRIITLEEAKSEKIVFKENTIIVDEYENRIMIPEGFKVASDSATDVTGGIVIEDATYINTIGSQFVWIPVGKVNDAEKVETITLARYTFASDGKPSAYSGSFTEDTGKNHDSRYGNKIAKDVEDFKTKVINSSGYWIGRYEAGKENNNLVCKYDKGVYNKVTQLQASILSQDMYKNRTFTSDLVNSYAWDTAIVFIQKFSGDTKYSKKGRYEAKLANTGKATDGINNDVRCNIYDMAGNCYEWTTETYNSIATPCVMRSGSYWDGSGCTSNRGYRPVNYNNGDDGSFRMILYL